MKQIIFLYTFLFLMKFCAFFCLKFENNNNNASSRRSQVLLISLDGLRSDKLDLYLSKLNSSDDSCLKRLALSGIKAEYMTPVFPSLTSTNHYSLVTGLYSESHGILGNDIFDPLLNLKANLVLGINDENPNIWNKAEPIWLTARKQGLKTAAALWPGSAVRARSPGIFLYLL
jgi:predicted AlkP superfamily pyrophosphatase or phosphodiesterase